MDLEIDEELKNFTKGYNHKGIITLLGEYLDKHENYQRNFNIKITINIPSDINYEILNKIEEYMNHDKNIWENEEDLDYALELLNKTCVEYFLASKGIPTAHVGYNIIGGINLIS